MKTSSTCARCGWAVEKNLNSGEWLDEWGSPLCSSTPPRSIPHKPRGLETPENEAFEAVTKL